MKLRRVRTYLIPLVLLVVISPACSKSPEDQAVTELIEKASLLVGKAAALREENPDEADRLESEAIVLLEEAIFNHPSSSIVTELYKGEILVGPYTLHNLEDRVSSRMDIEKYDSEEEEIELDPLSRAVTLSEKPGPPYLKAIVLARLAAKYREADDSGRVSELMAAALTAAEEIEKDYFKSRALVVVSDQYELAGEESRASGILDEAIKLANGIKYSYFQSGALAEIAGQYIESGKYNDALMMIERIKDPYFQAGALIEISVGNNDFDNPRAASELLLRAEAISEEIDSPHFHAEILARVASGYASIGEGEKSSGLLVSAFELADGVVEPVSRAAALIEVGKGHRTVGEEERAIEIISRANDSAGAIENNIFKDQILQKIAEEYIAMGEYERASDVEAMIDDARSKALVLASMAESYNNLGDKEQTEVFVTRTIEASDKIKNPLFQADALLKIADLYRPSVPPTVEVQEEEQVPPSEF